MFSAFLRGIAALAGWRALLAAFGLGLLAALALPPVYAVPVLLVSIPGLLALIGAARTSPLRAATIGLFWGWGHHVGGLYWITNAILTEVDRFWWLVPIAVPAVALPLGLFIALPAWLARRAAPGWPRLLVFAGAWVVAEMLRGVLFTGFPWNLIGTVWAFSAVPLQGAAWVGVHGLSLATILLAGLPVLGRGRALPGGAAALALLGFGAFGAVRLAAGPEAAAQMIEWAGGQQAIEGKGMQRLTSPEIIAQANPDIILMTEFGFDRLGSLEQAKTLPGVAQTEAARTGRIFRLSEHDLTYFNPDTGACVERLAALIHGPLP